MIDRHRDSFGVTLVEMLIVVATIALLAAIVVPLTLRLENQSKERGLEATFVLLEGALQEYHEYLGSFPEQTERDAANVVAHAEYMYDALQSLPESRAILGKVSDSQVDNKAGTSVPEVYDPWGTALDYWYGPGHNFPELVSAGPDRVFGTSDDISSRTK